MVGAPVVKNALLIQIRQSLYCGYDALAHARIAGIVPSPVNNDQFATRPTLRELPRRNQRRTDIQSTMN